MIVQSSSGRRRNSRYSLIKGLGAGGSLVIVIAVAGAFAWPSVALPTWFFATATFAGLPTMVSMAGVARHVARLGLTVTPAMRKLWPLCALIGAAAMMIAALATGAIGERVRHQMLTAALGAALGLLVVPPLALALRPRAAPRTTPP